MRENTPKWESQFWTYLSNGNGMSCPLYDRCLVRKMSDDWCGDENKGRVFRLIDSDGEFDPNSFGWIKHAKHFDSSGLFRFVEKLANKFLRAGKVSSPPVPSELIHSADAQRKVRIQTLEFKSCHAVLWREKEWLVQLRAGDTDAVRRFTLLHEAFHILAHCNARPVFGRKGAAQGAFNELLADYFAICVLMPRLWVREKWAEAKALNRMAEIFEVPKPTMWFRLRELGLV